MEHEHSSDESLWEQILENLSFILVALLVIAIVIFLAVVTEKLIEKKTGKALGKWTAKKVATTGILSALGGALMLIEIPLVFLVPDFYKLDFSEIAGLMAGFLLGPVAGVTVEFIKAILHILLHGTHSAFVGEFASFVIGCVFVIPSSVIYMTHRTKKGARIALVTGALLFIVFASFFNAFYLIPKFASLYGVSVDIIVKMGSEINSRITSLESFVIFATAPFNLIKSAAVSVIVLLIYKPVSSLYRKI